VVNCNRLAWPSPPAHLPHLPGTFVLALPTTCAPEPRGSGSGIGRPIGGEGKSGWRATSTIRARGASKRISGYPSP